MPMPASGCIAIISAPQTCGSICAAVGCASGSLLTLSAAAGPSQTGAMSDFYGYTPSLALSVQTNWVGVCGAGYGMCGQVYLKCGVTVVCSAPIFAWTQGECVFNWSPPLGTYCVRWCNFCRICSSIQGVATITWSKDNPPQGGGGVTNVNSTSFSASGCIQGNVS